MFPLFHQVPVARLDQPERVFELNIAEEVPVRLVFNGMFAHGIMMMTPDGLEDFAYGYCLTEQIVGSIGQIRSVMVSREDDGLLLDISITGEALSALIRRSPRARTGHSSCGICGSDEVPSPEAAGIAALGAGPFISTDAVRRALDELGEWQALNAVTRMVHAAAWADCTGRIRMIREDVGRHNALDKLIGVRARDGGMQAGLCVLTSRYSYEMALKTLRAGIAIVVAVSAPTYRACRLARMGNQTLIAIARRDGQMLFCGGERLVA